MQRQPVAQQNVRTDCCCLAGGYAVVERRQRQRGAIGRACKRDSAANTFIAAIKRQQSSSSMPTLLRSSWLQHAKRARRRRRGPVAVASPSSRRLSAAHYRRSSISIRKQCPLFCGRSGAAQRTYKTVCARLYLFPTFDPVVVAGGARPADRTGSVDAAWVTIDRRRRASEMDRSRAHCNNWKLLPPFSVGRPTTTEFGDRRLSALLERTAPGRRDRTQIPTLCAIMQRSGNRL